jgi:hypothetical protein
MRMGACTALMIIAGFMAVCLFDLLHQLSTELAKVKELERRNLEFKIDLKGKH